MVGHYYGSDNPDNCCTMVYLLYIPDQFDSTVSPDSPYYWPRVRHNYTSLQRWYWIVVHLLN